jgi:hypothetical protein
MIWLWRYQSHAGLMGGMMMSKNIMNTTIKGQHGYDQSFNDKHRDELQQTKDFLWIYKG